jgi:hypothetical protein
MNSRAKTRFRKKAAQFKIRWNKSDGGWNISGKRATIMRIV